jgi:hypothetical protein
MANKTRNAKAPKVIGRLEDYFKKTLGDKSIVIRPQHDDPDFYTLIGGTAIYIIDTENGHGVSLIPIFKKEKNYWLSLSLAFKGALSDLSTISITVFTGIPYGEDQMEKLFRAEWHQEDIMHGHAQPHWHFHIREKEIINSDDWEQEQKAVSFGTKEEDGAPTMKMIHFAMAAQWHEKGPGSHIIELKSIDDTKVLNWISSAFEYILHQLNYLERKTG